MSINALGATFRDFVLPLKDNFSAPFMLAWHDFKTPFSAVWKSPSQEDNYQLLRAILRPTLAATLVFAHRVAWNKVHKDFGHWGSAVICATLYEIGNYCDPKANYMGSSAWLLFKGASGLLKSEGSDRIAMVCLLLLKARIFEDAKFSRLFDNFPIRNIVWAAANGLFWVQKKYLSWQGRENS